MLEVKYIPQLKRNLISLGALESKGYTFKSENGLLQVMKQSGVVMQGYRKNCLYYLDARVVGNTSVVPDNDVRLWYLRCAHMSRLVWLSCKSKMF